MYFRITMVSLFLPRSCFILCTYWPKPMTHSVAIMGWQRQKLSPATFSGICRSCRGGRHIDSVAYTIFTIRWPAERCQEEPSGPIDDYDGCSCAGWDSVWQHQHCRRCWVGSYPNPLVWRQLLSDSIRGARRIWELGEAEEPGEPGQPV